MKQDKRIFQKDYFTKYYEPMTGKFGHQDLVRNKNWFYGWFNALQEWYNFKEGNEKKVLEIGCSIGAACQLLSERGFKVTGSDISSYAIKGAKKVVPKVAFEVLDIETSKKYQNTFDVIFAFEVIEHLGDLDAAFANIYRMLKKGGVFIASTPYPYSYVFIDKTHINVRHPLDWMRLLKQHRFKNTKWKQIMFIPFFYRYSPLFHFTLPIGLPTPYVNSPIFLYGKK
ncbi:MAG: class I SAM-dependent methyltransferase [Patescibacteria group bacterium]